MSTPQSNQSGIESRDAIAPDQSAGLEPQSNQSGIERALPVPVRPCQARPQSNQSGVESHYHLLLYCC